MNKPLLFLLLVSQVAISQINPINLYSGSIKIPALQMQQFVYAFTKGDRIVVNFKEVTHKDLNKIEIFELPTNLKYSAFKTSLVDDEVLNVYQTGIYLFRFTNTSLAKRVGSISIQRFPKDESTRNFNSNVVKKIVSDTTYTTSIENKYIKTNYYTEKLIDKQKFFINSGSNAVFKGGKSRIAIPINLPRNTVEWYYTFSASRNQGDIENVSKNMQLASELTHLIDQTGILSFGINQLSQPPGADYCDVYLIDFNNYNKFLNKDPNFLQYTIGTRENMVSGTVKVDYLAPNLYLGIRNPDATHGINFIIEVVAIVKEDIFEPIEVKIPHITTQEKLFIQD